MVGLCVDVLWMVIWLSVRAVGAVCKVEGDVQVVNTFDRHRHLQPYKRRVRTGHGKPGKSWNLSISVSRPGKSWNLIVGYGKAWKIIVCVVRKLLQVSISKDKIKYSQVMSEDTRKEGRFSKVAAKL